LEPLKVNDADAKIFKKEYGNKCEPMGSGSEAECNMQKLLYIDICYTSAMQWLSVDHYCPKYKEKERKWGRQGAMKARKGVIHL
jgi:hypothetical protein